MTGKTAYIGLGSNLNDRLANLQYSLGLLLSDPQISLKAVSAVYETEPFGGPPQGPFLNACAVLTTGLTPVMLLRKMLDVEEKMGRIRKVKWGPRIIDLDLLIYENVAMDTDLLQLPHPRLGERNFVLVPLADVAPDLPVPGKRKTVSGLLADRDADNEVTFYQSPAWFPV